MKRLVFLLSVIVFANTIYGQYFNSTDWMNGKPEDYLRSGRNNSNSNNTPQQGGIRIEIEYGPIRTTSNSNYHAQQQAKNAQRNADHQEWLRRKNEAARLAAERERQRRIEEERERQRKYDKTYTEYMITTERHAATFHDNLEYKATTGKDFMYNYQPKGTEKLQHRYVPSSDNVSTSDIVEEQMRTKQKIIDILEATTTQLLSYYDKLYLAMIKYGSEKDAMRLEKYMVDLIDWWDRTGMAKTANIFNATADYTKNLVNDPLGTIEKTREATVNRIKESLTLENIAKKGVGLIPDRNVKNIGETELNIISFLNNPKEAANQAVNNPLQFSQNKREMIQNETYNLFPGINEASKVADAINKPNEWKNYLTNKATKPLNSVKKNATGEIKKIVKKEIDPNGTIF